MFLFWLEPGNAFYKLLCWPAIVLLIGILSPSTRKTRPTCSVVRHLGLRAPGILAAFIYPHTKVDADPVYALAQRMNQRTAQNRKGLLQGFQPGRLVSGVLRTRQRLASDSARAEIRKARRNTRLFRNTALPDDAG